MVYPLNFGWVVPARVFGLIFHLVKMAARGELAIRNFLKTGLIHLTILK